METASFCLARDENGAGHSSEAQLPMKRKTMEARDADRQQGKPLYNEFEWENSKENVMPLKRGRNVPELNRALRAQDSFQEKLRVEEHAKQMETELKEYKGDDPLSVWLQYIRWIEAKMPEDTRKKFSVLEKCTRVLKEDARYKNDIRYIRVWIQYADLVSNPKDIFKYLYQNKIGEHVSLFYVGWAWVLESMTNYAQAHKVYLKATQNADWKTLDTRRHQNKENEVAAGKWNQAIPRQNAEDDEFSASHAKSESVAHVTARSCTLRQRFEGASTEEEQLAKKPLKNFGQKADEKPDQADASRPAKKQKGGNNIKSETLGYNLDMMKTHSGELLSFEEVRAQAYISKGNLQSRSTAPPHQNQFPASNSSVNTGHSSYPRQQVNSFLDTSATTNTSARVESITRKLSFATSTKKLSPRRQRIPAAKLASLDHAAQEDVTINTRVALSEVNDMFCSPDREPEGKVWDIREEDPVERKLHFSIFDDSVDSIAPSMHEHSIREDMNNSILKQSFQIYADDATDPPQTEVKGKGQQRKPLGSRDDLLRSGRLTNKDVLMQLRTGKMEKIDEPLDIRRHSPAKPSLQKNTQVNKIAKGQSLDPYSYENRLEMIQNKIVDKYLALRSDVVHFHSSKLPVLPCQNPQKRKLKKPIVIKLASSFKAEVIGHLGSGAFAHVFSTTVSQKDKRIPNMAVK
uniref:BUB1 N-terminal domain-containing protein n=1 Tax=Globisporangium ultimum (strain ATCC 200006 / CBS 805.95 / DAOM BR144) TaxID=431595 RepID=K3WKM0_GLOUD